MSMRQKTVNAGLGANFQLLKRFMIFQRSYYSVNAVSLVVSDA
jgi:hypothetical protein